VSPKVIDLPAVPDHDGLFRTFRAAFLRFFGFLGRRERLGRRRRATGRMLGNHDRTCLFHHLHARLWRVRTELLRDDRVIAKLFELL
jgi:hypothetical protein